MRDAFLTFMADDGIVFQPRATNAKQLWTARPESKATLIWEPSFASISSAGDLGYTTGPWEFRPPGDSTGASPPPDQITYGHFISVWRKQSDGVWKVAVDIGVVHDRPARGLGQETYVAGPSGTRNELGAAPDIAALERKLSETATKSGWAKAIESMASDELRLNRARDRSPFKRRDAARRALSKDKLAVTWHPEGTGYASSRDLGYAYGVAATRPQKSKSAAPDSESVSPCLETRGEGGVEAVYGGGESVAEGQALGRATVPGDSLLLLGSSGRHRRRRRRRRAMLHGLPRDELPAPRSTLSFPSAN